MSNKAIIGLVVAIVGSHGTIARMIAEVEKLPIEKGS